MVKYIIKLLVVAGALLVAEHFVSGITVDSFWPTAVLAAFIFGLLNVTVKPILKILAFPITFISLGFFGLLINILVFWLITFVHGVTIDGFVPAMLGLIIVTIVSWVADIILK